MATRPTTGSTNVLETVATRGVSRRAVVRTAAWSAPAIAVVSAAPAFAASGDATWNVDSIDGFRAAQNTTVKTTSSDGRMLYLKAQPILTNAFVSTIPATLTVSFPSGGGGVGYEPSRGTLPSGWSLSQVTAPGGTDITASAATATNGLVWTFSGPVSAATGQIVAVFGKNATNAGASGAIVTADVASPISAVFQTSSVDIAVNRRKATITSSGTGTNTVFAGPATFSA